MAASRSLGATALDAARCKLSATRCGYYKDPFTEFFVDRPDRERRAPVIHRGYYARVAMVDAIIKRFLAVNAAGGTSAQVVSLGAGLDTTFWRLATAGHVPAAYVEVDLPAMVTRKAALMAAAPAVVRRVVEGQAVTGAEVDAAVQAARGGSMAGAQGLLPAGVNGSAASGGSGVGLTEASRTPVAHPGAHAHPRPPVPTVVDVAAATASHSLLPHPTPASADAAVPAPAPPAPRPLDPGTLGVPHLAVKGASYRLVAADLCDLPALAEALLAPAPLGAGLNPSLPTLFIAECVLVYLPPAQSSGVIAWAAAAFPRCVFASYDPIRPNDAFGRIMTRNLAERGFHLASLQAFPDPSAQIARFRGLGFSSGSSYADMNCLYYHGLARNEVARVETLEWLDEVEEWHLLCAHYGFVVAVKDEPVGEGAAASERDVATLEGRAPAIAAAEARVTALLTGTPLRQRAASTEAASPGPSSSGISGGGIAIHHHHAADGTTPTSPTTTAVAGAVPRRLSPELVSMVTHVSESITAATGAAVDAVDVVAPSVEGGSGGSTAGPHLAQSPLSGLPEAVPGARSGHSPSAHHHPHPLRHAAHHHEADVVHAAHTSAGTVVFDAAPHLNFDAIAEAEREMEAARHTREAVGIDAIRARASASLSPAQARGGHGGAGGAGGAGVVSPVGTTLVAGGGGVASPTRGLSAEAVIAAAAARRFGGVGAGAGGGSSAAAAASSYAATPPAGATLACMLFPTEEWAVPVPHPVAAPVV